MRVVHHPAVQRDVNGMLRYYEGVSLELADEFWNELRRVIALITANPQQAHPAPSGLRRVNLRRFPCHILFRLLPTAVRIVVVPHHKRNPKVGMSRH
jgi:plasmid stabilization system protein ParE